MYMSLGTGESGMPSEGAQELSTLTGFVRFDRVIVVTLSYVVYLNET